MRFARIVFSAAAIWGILVITPLFFIFNLIGRDDPPPITHPGFYYGFATTALAWQIAFAVIAWNPARLRPLMIPSVIEKFGYAICVVVLFLQRLMHAQDLLLAAVDGLLGILFLIAFFKTQTGTERINQ